MRRIFLLPIVAVILAISIVAVRRIAYPPRPAGPLYTCPATGEQVFYTRDCKGAR